jgi:hypothetical protein
LHISRGKGQAKRTQKAEAQRHLFASCWTWKSIYKNLLSMICNWTAFCSQAQKAKTPAHENSKVFLNIQSPHPLTTIICTKQVQFELSCGWTSTEVLELSPKSPCLHPCLWNSFHPLSPLSVVSTKARKFIINVSMKCWNSASNPLGSKVRKFIINLSMKCWNSASDPLGSKVRKFINLSMKCWNSASDSLGSNVRKFINLSMKCWNSASNPLGPKVRKFIINLSMKCWNSASNPLGSRAIVIVVHVGAVKRCVAAVWRLRRSGKRKDRMKLSLNPSSQKNWGLTWVMQES